MSNRGTSPPPLTTGPVNPTFTQQSSTATRPLHSHESGSTIRAAAAQMVFAARGSGVFITPEQVTELERWTGQVMFFFFFSVDAHVFFCW